MVIDDRANLNSPALDSIGEELLDRLPGLFRDASGDLAAILRALSESIGRLRCALRDLDERQGGGEGGSGTAAEPGDGGLAGRRRLAELLGGGAAAAAPHDGAGSTSGDLRRWLENRTGWAPILRPGLRLETVAPSAKGRLRVRCRGVRDALAVIWSGSVEALPAADRLRELWPLPAEFQRPGLQAQFARLDSPPPRNLDIEGLLLDGVIIAQ